MSAKFLSVPISRGKMNHRLLLFVPMLECQKE
jgi:hypothetical protein